MTTLQTCPPHLSHVATLPREIQISYFQHYYSYILPIIHVMLTTRENVTTLTCDMQFLLDNIGADFSLFHTPCSVSFIPSFPFHSPSMPFGAAKCPYIMPFSKPDYPDSRVTARQHFLSVCVVQLRNKLPEELVSASSVSAFISRLNSMHVSFLMFCFSAVCFFINVSFRTVVSAL